ncbi:hypothetical protein Btru_016861 [Bulinus truncatus]|nr:hypothetical protein Btru_016861 [Bulinus truncatus]
MEISKINIHTSVENSITAQNITSSLQSNVLQLPHSPSAVLPLNSVPASSPVCLLPISIINQPQIPPLQRQPLSTEPVLLLPASSLSLSVAQSLNTNASLLSTKMTSTSPLQQQLMLNNAQLPVMIKPPPVTVQIGQPYLQQEGGSSQSIVVLPLGPNENLCHTADRLMSEPSSGENKTVNADSTDSISVEKWTSHRTSRRKSTKISEICSMREKLSANNKKFCPGMKNPFLSAPSDATDLNKFQSDPTNSTIKNTDISQIISSLPPGWQVIGLTGLDQLAASLPASTFSDSATLSQPNPLGVSTVGTNITSSTVKPSLVCVNLNNVSQPVASESFDSSAVNELTCSVKLDDLPCTHVISIKTEQMEDEEAKPDSTSDDQSVKRTKEKMLSTRKVRGNLSKYQTEKSRSGGQSGKMAKKSTPEIVSSLHSKSPSEGLETKAAVVNDQWTIVGVTSIPPTTGRDISTVSNSLISAPTVTSSSSDSSSSQSLGTDQSSDTIILKIPICPSSTKSTNRGRRRNSKAPVAKINLSPTSTSSSPSLSMNESLNENLTSDFPHVNKSEDMKWTVVGLTHSPLSQVEPSSSAQQILPSGEPAFLSCPPGSSPISQISAATLPVNNSENTQRNNLLNIMSALPPVHQLLIQSALSHQNQNSSPEQQVGQSKTSEETTETPQNDLASLYPSNNEWKVVGVTPIGIPQTAINPFTQLNPFPGLSSVLPMPLLIPTATSLPLPLVAGVSSPSLVKCAPTETVSTASSSVTSSMASVVGLAGSLTNTPVFVSSQLQSCFNQVAASDIEALQALRYQQGLEHLIQNNLEILQHPLNLLKANESNPWNLVGMLANSQVSLFDQHRLSSLTSSINAQDLSAQQMNILSKVKESKLSDTCLPGATVRETLASKLKCSEAEAKPYSFKCKNSGKLNESEHIKKNTVSSLLRMKRLQKSRPENSHRLDSINYMDIQDKADLSRSKVRSLRSYAGNRSLFTKTKELGEKIHLRSGTHVPVVGSNPQNEDELFLDTEQVISEQEKLNLSEVEDQKQVEKSAVKIETHSAARKRKLKVPRRMVAADTEYHPFDSSSDTLLTFDHQFISPICSGREKNKTNNKLAHMEHHKTHRGATLLNWYIGATFGVGIEEPHLELV